MNKGWAGNVVERYLGIPQNSSRNPNLGAWELKVVPMKRNRDGELQPRETMAITQIDRHEVAEKGFYESHLYTKLRKLIMVTRERVDPSESSSQVLGVYEFRLDDHSMLNEVVEDYEEIRSVIVNRGFDELTGRMGKWIQPRTKGKGHGTTTRAFYARKCFVEQVMETAPVQKPARRQRSDCATHAGKANANERGQLDSIMHWLPANQSGVGRHKCVYCAYKAGYADALAELGR